MRSNMNRRALMAGAAAVPVAALPALPALGSEHPDAKLFALGERLDRLYAEYWPLHKQQDEMPSLGDAYKAVPMDQVLEVNDFDCQHICVPLDRSGSRMYYWSEWMVDEVSKRERATAITFRPSPARPDAAKRVADAIEDEGRARLAELRNALQRRDDAINKILDDSGHTRLCEQVQHVLDRIATVTMEIMETPHSTLEGAAVKAKALAYEYDNPRDDMWRANANDLDWELDLLRRFLESMGGRGRPKPMALS